MLCRAAALLALGALTHGAPIVGDVVSYVQRGDPYNLLEPHPDQKADKAKRAAKEMQKHMDELARFNKEHEKQITEEHGRKVSVENNKRKNIDEKTETRDMSKAVYRANEENERNRDNEMKSADYEIRNSRRAKHTLQRAKDEEVRRSAKDILKQQAQAELEKKEKEEAMLFGKV
mmetsp:Transcript_25242/g.79628  ORF Transcript_25242/g.79628 Transcript_25242/m.79628 type:complete len:175 (+) Transcript_25242:55-579(+)